MRCPGCGALQPDGAGYCQVCAAPLLAAVLAPSPRRAGGRGRLLTTLTVAGVALLLLFCLGLVAATLGLTALIRWG